MTVDQLLRAYGTPTEAKKTLGYTLQTFRNWRRDGIPVRTQAYIEWVTNGQFKADRKPNGKAKR